MITAMNILHTTQSFNTCRLLGKVILPACSTISTFSPSHQWKIGSISSSILRNNSCWDSKHHPPSTAIRNCLQNLNTYSTFFGLKKTREPPIFLKEYTTIYKFPYIVSVRILSRLKLYQTGLLLFGTPASTILFYLDMTPVEAVYQVVGLATFACIVLYAMGHFVWRTIGFMYLSHDNKNLRVAHLDFWGNRKDITIPVEDIVPIMDQRETPINVYMPLRRYSSKNILYFSLKYGGILDREKFEFVFGELK